MTVFRCQSCGAPLPASEEKYITCPYCGLEQNVRNNEKDYAKLDNAFVLLKNGAYADAAGLLNAFIREVEADNALAYLGLLMAELRVPDRKDIAGAPRPLSGYTNFVNAKEFASPQLRAELEKAEQENLTRLQAETEAKWLALQSREPQSAEEWEQLAEEYDAMHYQNSSEIAAQCRKVAACKRKAEELGARVQKGVFSLGTVLLYLILAAVPYFVFHAIDNTWVPTSVAVGGAAAAAVAALLIIVGSVLKRTKNSKKQREEWAGEREAAARELEDAIRTANRLGGK